MSEYKVSHILTTYECQFNIPLSVAAAAFARRTVQGGSAESHWQPLPRFQNTSKQCMVTQHYLLSLSGCFYFVTHLIKSFPSSYVQSCFLKAVKGPPPLPCYLAAACLWHTFLQSPDFLTKFKSLQTMSGRIPFCVVESLSLWTPKYSILFCLLFIKGRHRLLPETVVSTHLDSATQSRHCFSWRHSMAVQHRPEEAWPKKEYSAL